jgi:hypothetical protein
MLNPILLERPDRLEQFGEAFLGKMPVMRQHIGDTLLMHRDHRNAVG